MALSLRTYLTRLPVSILGIAISAIILITVAFDIICAASKHALQQEVARYFPQKISIGNTGKIPSDVTRQLISIGNTGKTHSEKSKQLISENRIGKCCGEDNPNYEKTFSDATRQLMSINHADVSVEKNPMYGKHHSPATKQLMSIVKTGKNNSQWKGGISREPYCPIWSPWLKEEIKERDNHQCQNPDCLKTTKRLACHHIDYNKKNCSANNLITLCNSCNSRANGNRKYWEDFYTSIIKNNVNNRGNINDN